MWDRGTKYAIGLSKALKLGCSHVMFFDADDFLHRSIATAVEHNCDNKSGLYAYTGLERCENTGRTRLKRNFHRCNGSSHVIPTESLVEVDRIKLNDDQATIASKLGKTFVTEVLGDHQHTLGVVRQRGYYMQPFPFPAAIWNQSTGENWSGHHGVASAATESRGIGRRFGYEAKSHGWRSILGDLHYFGAVALARHRQWRDRKSGRASSPAIARSDGSVEVIAS
jgi:hypothetical protein